MASNTLKSEQNGRQFPVDILNALSGKKYFQLNFHWIFFQKHNVSLK